MARRVIRISFLIFLLQVAGLTEVFCRDAEHASIAVGMRIVAGNAGEFIVSERKRSRAHGGHDADLVLSWRHPVRVAVEAERGKRFFKEQGPLVLLMGGMAERAVLFY